MRSHDEYGKKVLREAVGSDFTDWGPPVWVDYKAGRAQIDGVVGSLVAVEIESRVPKQIRGAVLDLIFHPYPKKLLILLPVHMANPIGAAEQCRNILGRFLEASDFRVVVLRGTGDAPRLNVDAATVRAALAELGWAGYAS